MKKFLFTLAALFIAGTAFAENYFYVAEQDYINASGATVTVPVRAHFEECVSAATVNLILPEGMTVTRIQKGSSLAELMYVDEYGDEWEAENTIFTPANATKNFAFATVDKGFYEVDGEWVEYGAVKLLPGDYEEIAKVTIRLNGATFDAGISVTANVSCGADKRPANMIGKTCAEAFPSMAPMANLLEGEVVIADVNEEDGFVGISYEGDENAAIRVSRINGDEVTPVEGGIMLPAAGTYFVSACATAEGYNEVISWKIITWEGAAPSKLDCDSPSIQRINNNDGTYTIQIMAGYTEDFEQQTDGKLNYDVDVEPEVATFNAELNAWELEYAAGTDPYDVNVTAWTEASETFNASAEAEAKITIPALPQVATPSMSYTYDNVAGTITVTATTTTEGATCYVVDPDGVAHEAPYTFNYDIYEGYDANWTAYATAPNMTQSENCEAYNVVVDEVEKVYQTEDPEINAVPDNAREVVVITVTGEGNIVVTVTGVNGQIASAEGTEPVVVEVPFLPVGSEPEFVSVKAVATADLPAGYDRVLPGTNTLQVEIPAKQEVVLEDLTGELVFSEVDQTNGTFTVTYEGPEEDVVVTIVGYQERGANGQLPEQGKYYNVTAKASKAGYNDLTDNDELIWLYKPVIDVNVETVQQWIGPEDNAVLTTGQIVTLEGIENDNPDGVIMYSIDGGIAKVWTGEAVEVTGNGDHVIEAWVVANGDVESEHATETIHIDNDFTAVNEIANGKAVAGVRYFNLAGQEMTEANGVTIVVTTYTDGTTSAVKVMK